MRTRIVLLLFASVLGWGQVHKVPVSTNWYPSDSTELGKLLDSAWQIAEKRTASKAPRKHLRGIIAPHAAIVYSGTVAAAAYRELGHPKNVILLGFSHQKRLDGIFAPDLDAYRTPLGDIQVNRKAVHELRIPTTSEAELCDHSLENQLPFIKRAAPDAALIPLYVGQLDDAALGAIGKKLAARVKAGDAIVASSDFTHYGEAYGYKPFPVDARTPKRLMDRAVETFEEIGALDVAGFDRFVGRTGDTLCGWGPIRVLMSALSQLGEEVYMSVDDYLASGALTKDYSTSVSYGALAFHGAAAFGVGPEEGRKLLGSARATLDNYLATGNKDRSSLSAERDPDLELRAGVFVTIRRNGELRGCVGALTSDRPLWQMVPDRTLAAAAQDPRFPAVTRKDQPLSLEVSVLTPLRRIPNWKQFHIGQGAVILSGNKSGVLLPQVAAEMGWTRPEQFLEGLSLKAGLEPQAYRDARVNLYVYSAQVFSEVGPTSSAGR